mgnify:CR=1 FL=1
MAVFTLKLAFWDATGWPNEPTYPPVRRPFLKVFLLNLGLFILPFWSLRGSEEFQKMDRDNSRCGIYSAYLAGRYNGDNVSLDYVGKHLKRDEGGYATFAELQRFLASRGILTTGIQCKADTLKLYSHGFILNFRKSVNNISGKKINIDHFSFAVYSKLENKFFLADPLQDFHLIKLSQEKLQKSNWTSYALVIEEQNTKRKAENNPR